MTLIVGIKTNVGRPGIVMLADAQATDSKEKDREIKYLKYRKIETGSTWAMVDSGSINSDISLFYKLLRENPDRAKREIKHALKLGAYPQVLKLNQEIARRSSPDDTHEFMLATRYPDLSLVHIDIFGNTSETEASYLLVGIAAEKAKEYLEAQLTGTSERAYELTLERALRLGYETISHSAERDIYLSGPPSAVIVTSKKVQDFTEQHWNAIASAEKKSLEGIIQEINK